MKYLWYVGTLVRLVCYTFPTFPHFHILSFVFMTCLRLSHHNSTVCSAIMATNSSSCNTSAISSFVTLFPSSSSSFLKIFCISKSSIKNVLFFVSIWSFSLIMLFVKSFMSGQCNKLVTIIFSLSEIMPLCFCCFKKMLVCIAIVAPTSYQFSLCVKCM